MAKKYNCTVHGKPMYRVRSKIGEDLHGKPIYKSFYGDGKVEADRRRAEYFARKSHTVKTLGQLAEYYTYNILINERLSANTISLYEGAYRKYVAPSVLAIKPLYDVTSADLQAVVTGSVSATHKYLRRLFKWLSSQDYCADLMASVVPPKRTAPEHDITIFTDDERQAIISTPNDMRLLYLLAFATGLREGELLALRYGDIRQGVIHVARQVVQVYDIGSDGYKQYKKAIVPPKSAASIRQVPVPDNVLPQIPKGKPNDYIFTTSSGQLITRGNFRRAWQRHLKHAGVPYKKFHACRATYCTTLCQNGVPLETASKLMGHSDITVTAQYYRLVSDEELTSAVAKINALF